MADAIDHLTGGLVAGAQTRFGMAGGGEGGANPEVSIFGTA